jgi:hypothetical protein
MPATSKKGTPATWNQFAAGIMEGVPDIISLSNI